MWVTLACGLCYHRFVFAGKCLERLKYMCKCRFVGYNEYIVFFVGYIMFSDT